MGTGTAEAECPSTVSVIQILVTHDMALDLDRTLLNRSHQQIHIGVEACLDEEGDDEEEEEEKQSSTITKIISNNSNMFR
jgi:hypothetical protein